MTPQPTPINNASDEKLLKEIRDFHTYAAAWWQPKRDESMTDRRYAAGKPWSDEDAKARADGPNPRPCLNFDELNQYINAACNNLRQNKRGIKVEPAGEGSDSKSAELRQDLIRGIEYKSNAQSAYVTAFQQMYEGSYGFVRLGRRYVSQDPEGPDNQEITIKAIQNQDSVLYDPDCKDPDWGDARKVLVLDPMPVDDFKRAYPDSKVTDFTPEEKAQAKSWITDKIVVRAEYWRVDVKKVRNKSNTRDVEKKTVTQYITNGLEILERNPQPGTHVGIIPFIGLQRYVDLGSGSELVISSGIRLARDPQMALAFLATSEVEEAGIMPKVPYIGYKGQFESSRADWAVAHKQPFPYLEVDPITDSSNGAVLPKPERQQITPNFQAYEIAKDAARRAIQAAMGISALPTAAQRQNAKSGVALKEMAQSQQIGSFHFNDNFDRALQLLGRIIGEWIPVVYDWEGKVALHDSSDERKVVTINTESPYPNDKGESEHYPVDAAEHDYTVSTGPSNDSQRDAVADFLDLLISNLKALPVAPPQAAKLLALAIKMKQLGPKGDEMADIISPDPNDAQAQQEAAMQQGQQQMAMMQQQFQEVQAELQKLQLEKAGKVVDNQGKKEIAQMEIEARLTIAEITTKAQKDSERIALLEDMVKKIMDHGQAAGLQASAQQHDHEIADKQAQAAQAQQQLTAQQAQDAQSSDQVHQVSMAEKQAEIAQQQQEAQPDSSSE